jgi:hypothetical protein
MSQNVGGIDLLLFFSTGHLKVIDKEGQISLARSQELMDRIPNILDIAEQFLYHSNDFKFNPDWKDSDESSGSDIQG